MNKKRLSGLLSVMLVVCMLSSTCFATYAAGGGSTPDSRSAVSESAESGSNAASTVANETGRTDVDQREKNADSAVARVQAMIDALPSDVSDIDAVMEKIDAIDKAMDELSSEQLAQLDLSAYKKVMKLLESDSAATLGDSGDAEAPEREAQEFSFDDYLDALKVIISDENGEHVVDYKAGDSTDIDLGEIQRNATLSATLAFNPNKAAGNDDGSANPIIYGDTFTCTIPDILSNGAGGKWSGRLKDTTTQYGMTNGSVGDFTIEDGKLTIKFDEGYINETGGDIMNASLNFTGSFDAYGWEESSFEKSLYFGNLPIKVKFPAAEVKRNLSIEKTPVNYSASQFGSSSGYQGKTALNGTANVDADGYVTYSIKVTAAEDNTTFLDNVVISDVFTTDNVDLSSVVLLSAVKGAKDTDIKKDVVEQTGTDGNITGWNIGRLNRGEEATITFKIKIDKDKITEDVDAVRNTNPDSAAEEARLLKNTASAIADNMKNPVTDDAATKVQNYVIVAKSKNGDYDPDTGRQKFTVTITAPSDNKYTEHNVYIKDNQDSYGDWLKDMGIINISIKHADGTTTTGTADNPLYHDFAVDNTRQWHAYLDELKPGDVATIHTYIDVDVDKWYTESGSGSGNGISTYNNAYVGNGDLNQSSRYIYYSIWKNWISKSGSYSSADGTITWTMTGNAYDSDLPDANIEGMTVTDTIGSNQEMNDSEVLVTFYEPNKTTVRPYTGENARDGKLVVPTTKTGFTFVVPEGYGDCKYVVTYKTKVTDNYGPSKTYYNTGKLGSWSVTGNTTRPRIASIEKQHVERGADWAKWKINVLGPVKAGDALVDTISTSTDYMWLDSDDIDGLEITFNGKTVDPSLYKVVPTASTTAGHNKGFKLTFLGSITDTDDNGREITPTSQNPAVVTYKTHLKHYSYQTQSYYGNSCSMEVDGNTVDTSSDYFYRSTNPEISKKYKNTVGSDITWTLSVNNNGYGCYLIDENKNPIYHKTLGKGQQGGTDAGYYAIVTETIPKGLKYINAKYAGTKGYYAVAPSVEKLSETVNDDGSTTVKLLIGNLRHYEAGNGYSSTSYNTWGYYRVDINVVTQIVDEECLLDTTGKEFEWKNTAALTSLDGQPYEASATMNISHVAMAKEMKYDASTAPSAQFTIDMNEEEFDLDPDSDTIKVFDKSSSSLVVDTSSIKVIDTRDNSPVEFILDASQMAADGTFSLEVPDNTPLRITYSAGVSGAKDEEVAVSNVAYFEGQNVEEITSKISKTVKVLNAEAQAQSEIMIWFRKMDATGKILPGCIFKLEKYTADDGWTTVNDNIVTEDDSWYATKIKGLNKNVLYRLTETEAAENYILDETPHYFCIKTNKDSEVALPDDLDANVVYCDVAALINAYNSPYVEVKFSKHDEEDTFLPGASFKVIDADGNTIKDKNDDELTFTVNDEGELPSFYVEPGTYTLVETKAPDGYLPADDLTFTVNSDETVSVGGKRVADNTVICKDKPTSITIRKMDGSVTPNTAISGAKLQVLDGKTVKAEWTTDGKDHEITGVLNAGKTYKLHEDTAPDGFLLADDISFTIKDDGTIESTTDDAVATDGALVMVDEKPSLDVVKVNRNKHTDVAAGAPLAGVSLTMSQGDNEVRTWETSVDADDPTKEVAEHFDNLEAGKTYTITENSAPDGYQTISDFSVTPNTDGTFTVTGDDASYEDGVLTISNKYVPTPIDAEITVNKQITGSPVSDKTFTFEMTETGSNKTEQITITGAGDAAFAKKTFTEAGTYTYTVREVAGSDKGYTYASETHTVVITVDDDGKGTLSKTVTVDGTEGSEVTFVNAYNPLKTTLQIPVNKEFDEDSAERPTTEEYTFTIEGKTGDEPMPEDSSITATEDAAGVFDEITYTKVGTYEYTVSEKNDGKTGYTYADPVNIKVVVEDFDGQLGAAMFIVNDGADDEEATDLTFVNAYNPLETALQIPVRKLFTKDSSSRPTVEDFTFSIEGKTGDEPMPETAATTASEKTPGLFDEIKYTSDGTYEYTVSEKNDGKEGYKYAEPIDVKVVVSDVEGQLVATMYVGDEEKDTLEFTNSYTAPEDEDKDKPGNSRKGTPGTGDDNGLVSRFLILITSGVAAAYLAVNRRRRGSAE